MAAKLGATKWRNLIPRLSVYNHHHKPLSLSTLAFTNHNNNNITTFCRLSPTRTKAQAEAMEPCAKIPKLEMNGSHEDEAKKCEQSESFLKVKKLSEKAVLPRRGSPLSAGYDLSSAVDTVVPKRGKALVPTDLSIAIPLDTYARIAPRSGLAWKHGIDVGAGVVDADYRGPVGVILFNHTDSDFEVKTGDRIAQLILEKIVTPHVLEVHNLDATVRGDGGFGSTGV